TAFGDQVRALPGVLHATVATTLPLVGAPSATVEMDGGQSSAEAGPSVCIVGVDAHYFDTLSLPFVAGRPPERASRTEVVVNDAFVRVVASDQTVMGRHLRLTREGGADAGPWLSIAGVVPSIRQTPMGDSRPCVYVPLQDEPGTTLALIVRASGDPLALTPSVRATLARLDADVPLHSLNTMAQLSHTVRWASRTVSLVMSVFALIAFTLSMAGVYAVTAQGVTQRLHEIGVRLVLGAGARDIATLVARRALPAVAIGLLLGTAGGSGVKRLLGTVAIGQHASGSGSVVAIAALVVLTFVAACVPPLIRALRVDPGETLRAE
ncbi:MAG: hypothetical protein IT178_17660, partial [Acidobacteria bacterium]|nr:hypothetical protein [Acidobacteriota bacterium]